MIVLDACPLCGGRELAALPRPRRTIGGPLGAARDLGLKRCRACGFAFVDPRPDAAALAAFYAARDYTAHEPVDDAGAVRRARGQLDAIAEAGGALRGARVLDVGCGGGQLLAAARARGAIPCGVDVAAHALAACRRQGIEVFDSLDALGERRFDGVVMSHVLEHVPDLAATLARVRGLVAAGGWCCVEVPNVASLRARLSPPIIARLGADERHRAFPIHLSYFAPETLRRALADAGLAIVAVTTNGLGIDALIPRRGEPEAVPVPVSVPVSDPGSVSVSVPGSRPRGSPLRRLLKQLYFGSLLGENLVAVARPL